MAGKNLAEVEPSDDELDKALEPTDEELQAAMKPAPAPPPAERPGLFRRFLDSVSPSSGRAAGRTVGGMVGSMFGAPGAGVGAGVGSAAGQAADSEVEALRHSMAMGQPYTFGSSSAPGGGVDPLEAGKDGLQDAVATATLGRVFRMPAELAAARRMTQPLVKQLATTGGTAAGEIPRTPFSDYSEGTFGELRNLGTAGDRILAAPRSDAAIEGTRYATPGVAESGKRGSQQLRTLADELADDAAVARKGGRGDRVANELESGMRTRDDRLTEAKGRAIDEIRDVLPMRPTHIEIGTHNPVVPDTIVPVLSYPQAPNPGARMTVGKAPAFQPPDTVTRSVAMRPPGEKLVNRAFNEPDAFNPMMGPDALPARRALADVKSLGFDQARAADVKGGALADWFEANALGLHPEQARPLAREAADLRGTARVLETQRGGINQNVPSRSGFFANALDSVMRSVKQPRSTMLGMRPESLEASAMRETPRLLEVEAARRGLEPFDPRARTEAFDGMRVPFFDKAADLARPLATASKPAASLSATLLQNYLDSVRGVRPQK